MADYGFQILGTLAGEMAYKDFATDQALKMAQTANLEQETRDKQDEATRQQHIQDLIKLAGPKIAEAHSPSEAALAMAAAIAPEAPVAAMDMLGKASKMNSDEATATKTRLETAVQSANAAASLLGGVTDGPSLENAFQRTQMLGIDTGEVMPALYSIYKNGLRTPDGKSIPPGWTPELEGYVREAQRSIISEKDQSLIDLHESRIQTEAVRRRELQQLIDVVNPARVRAADALAEKRRKAGDTKVASDASIQKRTASIIQSDWDIDMTNPDQKNALNLLAGDVTTLAADIAKRTPGMTKAQAADAAYAQLIKQGAFSPFQRKPGTAGNPLPLPTAGGKIDPDNLEPGMTYTYKDKFGKAQVMTWNGKMFGTPVHRSIADAIADEESPAEDTGEGEEE